MIKGKTIRINNSISTPYKSKFLENIALKKTVYAAISLCLLNILFVIISQNNLPPEVPLFYGFSEGEKQLSQKWGLLIPGAISLIIILFNLILSAMIKNKFLKETLSMTSFVVSFLFLITVFKIVLLVGFF